MPAISVVMPVYNAEDFVCQAIVSILEQTFTDFELLIINDGSTDNSEMIITSFTDHRIRYVKNDSNLGIIATRNKGLNLALGHYIAMMDADDISFKERLERQYRYMSDHPSVGVCGALMEYMGDKKGYFGERESAVSAFTKLMTEPPFGQSTAFIRKTVLEKYGLRYNPDYQHAEDYKLWFDISHYAAVQTLPETLVCYRWHRSSDSSMHGPAQKQTAGKIQKEWFEYVLDRHLTKKQSAFFLSREPSCLAVLHYNLLCFSVLNNSGISVDGKLVMTKRMKINRLALQKYFHTRFGKVILCLVLRGDLMISKVVLWVSDLLNR